MLNRKYADLRHAPSLDPRVLRYDPARRPQSVVRLGPRSRRKLKGGALLGEPGWTWAIDLEPGRWYATTAIFDRDQRRVAYHVDLATPPEETDGVYSFLDLKLDLLVPESGEPAWLDQEEYAREVLAGSIPVAWQERVEEARSGLERDLVHGLFPGAELRGFRPDPV